MIFRTITDEVTGATKSIGLFGKSLSELKDIFSSINTNGLFKTSIVSKTDLDCITKYNSLIENGIPYLEAMEQATIGASDATKQMIKNANGNTIALDNLTLGAKAASVAMGLLSAAANALVMYGISKLITAWDDYKDKIHEVANENAEQAEKSAEYLDSLLDLQNQLQDGTKSSDELTAAFKEQLKAMGYTEDKIDDLIVKYGGLAGAINEATKEALENAKTDAYTDLASASKSLEVDSIGGLTKDIQITDFGTGDKELDKQINEILSKVASKTADNGGSWTPNKNNAEGLYEYYKALQEVSRLIQETASETDNQKLLTHNSFFMTTTYGEVTEAIDNLKESAEQYGNAINRLHNADAQLELANYLKTNSIDSKEAFDSYVEGIQKSENYSEEYKQVLLQVANDAFPQFSSAAKDAKNSLDGFGNETADLLGISETITELDTKLKPAMDALGEAYQDIFTSDGFTRENIGLDMFSSIKDELNELSDAGISIDYSSFEELYNVLNDTESSAEEIKDAFDEVAYSIASAALTGVEDFETLKTALDDLGYQNAEIIAFESLASNFEALKTAGLDLANMDLGEEDFKTFVEELGISSENSAQAINILTIAQHLNQQHSLDTTDSVSNLLELAKNAGYTGNVIAYLTELEQIYQDVASGKFMGERLRIAQSRAEELKTLIEEETSKINITPKAENQDWKPVINDAKSAGKKAGEEYKDALEKELSDLDDVLDFITDTIDNQIDAWNDQKDAAVDALEAERDAAIEALEAEKELLQEQIDAKQKVIDKIKEAREEREANIDLMRKEYELEKLQNMRTRLIYKNGQMVYENDTTGIRDAREEVDKAKENIEILKIEKEIDELEDAIDRIDKQIESTNKYYDKLIKQTEKYYENLIKGMEEYKSRWEEISELEEQAKIKVMLEELGFTTEDILNMSGEAFEQFKQRYVNILAEMNKGDESFLDSLSKVSGIAREHFGNVVTVAQEELSKMNQLGNDAGQGFVDGWNEKSEEIKSATKQTAEEAVDAFAEGQNSNSPSLAYKEKAYDAIEGLTTGIAENKQLFIDSVKSLAEEGVLAFGEAFNFEDSTLITSFDALKLLIQSVCDAVGLGTEDSVGGLLGALTTLSKFSLGGIEEGTGIIAQFNALKTAVDKVTTSINGGGSQATESGGLATGSNGGATTPTDGGGGSGGSGLTGAITEIGTATDETLGSGGEEGGETEGEGEGVLGKFAKFKTAVDDVTKAIGTDEETDDEEATLIFALRKHYEVAEETVPEVKRFFDELLASIAACVQKLGELAEGMKNLGTESITPAATGTTYAKKGLYLVGEEAPELIEDTKGNLSLATTPTLLNMKGGEKVYNGDETSKLLRPLDSSHPQYEMFMKAQKYFGNAPELSYPTTNVWSRKIDGMVSGIKNVNTINNTTPSYVLNGGVNVTCPNVTDTEIAKRIGGEIEKAFFGMNNYANQRVSITR